MIIQIEGLDYSGKSTVAAYLQEYLESTSNKPTIVVHNPKGVSDLSSAMYEYVKSTDCLDSEKKSLLTTILIKNFNDINELSKTHNIILDRGILSLYIYQFRSLTPRTFYTILEGFNFPWIEFDKTFVLTCNENDIQERKRMRHDDDLLDHYFLSNIYDIKDKYEDAVLINQIIPCGQVIRLDTSGLTEEETKDFVIGRL